jgi:hypothetical protein
LVKPAIALTVHGLFLRSKALPCRLARTIERFRDLFPGLHFRLGKVRTRHDIDAEPRLLAAVQRAIRYQGGDPEQRSLR